MNPLLRCTAVSKAFPGVQALASVDFDVLPGEVHALVGENGAGKSTLMHILAGVQRQDSGTVEFHRDAPVGIVYQERSLFDLLSVAENLFVNNQPASAGVIDRTRLVAESRKLLAAVDLDVDPTIPVGYLSPARQQMVEIAKALSFHPKLFILDEPTAALTFTETATLFRVIRQMKQNGVGVIYISHRLEEIFEIADRVSVLKDGAMQGTFNVSETSPEDLVSKMVGRERIHEHIPRNVNRTATPALEVKNLRDRKLRGISFSAYSGEILGIAGLAGAGRTELAMSIFGARAGTSGEILVEGRVRRIHSPKAAMSAGIGYLPEDRKELGLFLDMNIAQNIAAAHLSHFGEWSLSAARMLATARDFMANLRIAAPDAARAVRKLSGGNQQKVLLSRWLLRNPKVLIVDEPTRGIDVSAKGEIYSVLRALAAEGKSVIVISSDLPELLAIADRILVLRQGELAGELTAAEASEEAIMRYAAISVERAAS